MVKAVLTTARALSAEQLKAVTARFTENLGDTPGFAVRVDPALLGGICVEAKGVLYDGSVRRRLVGMRSAMLSED